MSLLVLPLILTVGYLIYRNSLPSFTLYHSHSCGHCKSVLPKFRNFTYPGVRIRVVEQSQNWEYPVRGVPAFVFRGDGVTVEFSGPRTPEAWTAFLDTQLKI